ncbi:putative ATP-dependent helicase DinG [bacterium HR37]|nr:putative ATP-dependent helicase DinG [bacterium HR37]
MRVSALFSEKIKREIEKTIKEASGNEVFFVGSLDGGGVVSSLRVVARGNEFSVPAIVDSASSGDVVIHNHPSGNLTPSARDIEMASVFGNRGVGFYIVNNDASEVYVVVEPFLKREERELNTEELKGLLLPGGGVAKVMGRQFEERAEQIQMLEAVALAFNQSSISLIEAGTGTGKTLAYLIPAVYWSILNGERVVVSTNTINLQEQLINKDLPVVQLGLGDKGFKYSLVKGMANYVCLLRVETVLDGLLDLAGDDEIDTLRNIVEWAKSTQDGSLSDLSFNPPEEVWDKVCAESESCLRIRCPYYSKCFFYKSRREMASSNILVVNHHLLFSDLSIKSATEESEVGILPSYRRVIFDEAHHIGDAATSHFGLRASKYGIVRTLRRLRRRGEKGEIKGLLFYTASLATKLQKYFRKGILTSVLERIESFISPRVDVVEESARDAFDRLYFFALPFSELKEGNSEEITLRITHEVRQKEGWEEVDKRLSLLRIRLRELEEEIRSFVEVLLDYENEDDVARIIAEYRGIANKVGFYSDVINCFLSSEEDGYVRWVEGRAGKGGIVSSIGLSPLDISSHLKERLYSRCKTVVMTSATMTVNGSFSFLKGELGLSDDSRVKEYVISSPFNYSENVVLAIPKDVSEPSEVGYAEDLSSIIVRAVKASRGNALILFTSYSLLDKVYGRVYRELEDSGILCLRQGSSPRSRLLDRFRVEDKSVLFATDSFWEGVDIPGDALRLLIITRLPFRVPTDPIIEARVQYLENQGINSFLEYTVPLAVLKFKQGFGRLIRTKTDKGVVMVLDKRIISKYYGKYFLNSLPRCRRVVGGVEEVVDEICAFFNSLAGCNGG